VEKPKVIKIGRFTDLTGPYAAASPPIEAGFNDYIQFLNEKGGIDGVPLEVMWTDVKQDAALVVNAYKRYKSEGALVVCGISSSHGMAVKRLIEEDRIPMISHMSNQSLFVPPSDVLWCQWVDNRGETLPQVIWFDTEVWDRTKMGRPWKIGFLTMDIAYCKGALPLLYKYSDDHDIEMVGTEITSPATLDFTINIKRLVAAGTDVIFLSQCGASAGVALRQMHDLGLLAPLEDAIAAPGKIVPLLNDCSLSLASLRAAPEAVPYVYGATPFGSWFEMDNFPGVKQRNEWMINKYGHIWNTVEREDIPFNWGWNNGMVIAKVIEQTVKAVGWDKLNSEAIIQKGLKGFRLETGLISGDLSYADYEGDRVAIEKVRAASLDVGKRMTRVPISDFIDMRKYAQYNIAKYTPKKPHPGMYVE